MSSVGSLGLSLLLGNTFGNDGPVMELKRDNEGSVSEYVLVFCPLGFLVIDALQLLATEVTAALKAEGSNEPLDLRTSTGVK